MQSKVGEVSEEPNSKGKKEREKSNHAQVMYPFR